MTTDPSSHPTWQQVLAPGPGGRYPIEAYWPDTKELATSDFGWQYAGGYLGNWMMFSIPSGPIDQISTWAKSADHLAELGVRLAGDPNEIVEVQVRFRQPEEKLPEPGQALKSGEWQGVNADGRKDDKRFVRILVDASKWNAADSHRERSAVLARAFVAGLRMFEDLAGIELPGFHHGKKGK